MSNLSVGLVKKSRINGVVFVFFESSSLLILLLFPFAIVRLVSPRCSSAVAARSSSSVSLLRNDTEGH